MLFEALITAIYASPKVKEAIQGLAKDALGAGKSALIRRLTPSAREKAAKEAIRLLFAIIVIYDSIS